MLRSHTLNAAIEGLGLRSAKYLDVFLTGAAIPNRNARGKPITDNNFHVIFNAYHEAVPLVLPAANWGGGGFLALDPGADWSEEDHFFEASGRIKATPEAWY